MLTAEEQKLKDIEDKDEKIQEKKRKWRLTRTEKKQEKLMAWIQKKKQKKAQEEVFSTEIISVLGVEQNLRVQSLDPITSKLNLKGDKNTRFWILISLLILAFAILIVYPNLIFSIYEVIP